MLNDLYYTYIENIFGRAGSRDVKLKEIIHFAEDLEEEGLVDHRCVIYLRKHPYLEYITQYPEYDALIKKSDIKLLEVGSFLGNEIRRFYTDGFQGKVIGIDKNPWHLYDPCGVPLALTPRAITPKSPGTSRAR